MIVQEKASIDRNRQLHQELLERFNRTGRAFRNSITLHELLEETSRTYPDRVALRAAHDQHAGANEVTFAELNTRVNQLARTLQAEGVHPGDVVGITMERSFAMVFAVLSTLKAGAAYLPISPGDPRERVRYFVKDAGAKLLLVHDRTDRHSEGWKQINVDCLNLDRKAGDNPPVLARPSDLAYVIYTSGSTGKPKGVMIEHRSVINRLSWMQNAYPIGADDVLLQKTPFSFDVSVWELFWWILAGARLDLLAPRAEKLPLAILQSVATGRVTVLHFVPSMLAVFLDYIEGSPDRAFAMASVRRVFCSGEPLLPTHVLRFNRSIASVTGTRLTNLYGPTETTVDVTSFDCPPGVNLQKVPIGRPIDNTRIYILDGNRPAAIGETGELCIGGVGVGRGYLNNPALTAERFVAHPLNPAERIYRTGDLARWLPDGTIEFLGRSDQQVKIRGLRIELGEIEETARSCPGISDCVVTTKTYSESLTLIVAYAVCADSRDLDTLKEHLRKHLPAYMVPNQIERVPEIPLGSTGKADRKALPEPTLGGPHSPKPESVSSPSLYDGQ